MDTEWRATINTFGPEVLATVEALERELPPAQGEQVLRLIVQVDEVSSAKCFDADDRNWCLILEHVPGLAPGLDLVRAHVMGSVEDCCHGPGGTHQRLRRRGEEAEE